MYLRYETFCEVRAHSNICQCRLFKEGLKPHSELSPHAPEFSGGDPLKFLKEP